jgi:hypothetical protein
MIEKVPRLVQFKTGNSAAAASLATLAGAAIFLTLYGTLWLSVRGQHPYKGPTGWALLIFYSLIIVRRSWPA